jgi:hypothetical protein
MDDRNYMEKMAEAVRAVSQKFIDEASAADNASADETMRRAHEAFERRPPGGRQSVEGLRE